MKQNKSSASEYLRPVAHESLECAHVLQTHAVTPSASKSGRASTHKEGVLGAGNEIATLDGTLDVGVLVDEVEEPVCVCMCVRVCVRQCVMKI